MERLEFVGGYFEGPALPCPNWKGRQEESVAWATVLLNKSSPTPKFLRCGCEPHWELSGATVGFHFLGSE
jgi:hypothetical protein